MIGALAPLRISFIGGGTDISKFYKNGSDINIPDPNFICDLYHLLTIPQ